MKSIKSIILSLILIFMMGELVSQTEKEVTDAAGITVGEDAPMFNAVDANNSDFSLQEAINEGPVVLIFYRGFWCPICNKHLGSIQDSLKMIEETGARVIAVHPKTLSILIKWLKKLRQNSLYYMMKTIKLLKHMM